MAKKKKKIPKLSFEGCAYLYIIWLSFEGHSSKIMVVI
jgi:hypothetical protein